MATYYVATTGNNSNSGTTGAPWLTITYAVSTHGLVAGDILNIRPGTYEEHLSGMTLSGTTGAHITIQAQTTGTVTILAPVAQRCITVDRSDQTYVDFIGLNYDATQTIYECIKAEAYGVSNDPNHITWTNFIATGGHQAGTLSQQQTILFSNPDPLTNPTGQFQLKNGIIHGGGDNDASHGMYISSNNCLIDNVYIDNIAGAGIQVYNGYGHALTSTTIQNCIITGFRTPIFGEPGHLPGRHWGVVSFESNCFIYNNIINTIPVGSSGGSADGIAVQGDLNKIYNNTIYNSSQYGIRIASGSTNGVFNNIVYLAGPNFADGGTGTLGGGSVPSSGTNLFGTDPLFVNATNGDFRLSNGSPAVDVGTTKTEVPNDITGILRPQGSAYDLGAYEQFNSTGAITSIISAALGVDGGTTTAASTSGLGILFIHVAWYPGAGNNPPLTDSQNNTWIPLTAHLSPNNNAGSRWYYCINPSTSASHTFTITYTGSYVSICVAGVSGSYVFDKEAGTGINSVATGQPGTVTPATAISILLQGICLDGSGNPQTGVAINSSYVIASSVPYVVSLNEGNFIAVLQLSSIAASNPTWTWTGTSNVGLSTLVFKSTSIPGTSGKNLILLGVGT